MFAKHPTVQRVTTSDLVRQVVGRNTAVAAISPKIYVRGPIPFSMPRVTSMIVVLAYEVIWLSMAKEDGAGR